MQAMYRHILKEIIKKEATRLLKEGASQEYDDLIKKTLKVSEIPTPVGDYKLGNNGNVNSSDLKIFKELYKVAPPKAGKEESEAGSKGSGHGEIAVYWLLGKGYSVQDGRGGGNPDLIVDGVGVEVKSYDVTKITLGRIGSDKKNQELLDEDLRTLSKKYSLIGNVYNRVDAVLTALNLQHDFNPEEAAGGLAKGILKTKLKTKPGFGGYLLNVSESGKLDYIQIKEDKVDSTDNVKILDSVYVNQSQLIVDTSIFS